MYAVIKTGGKQYRVAEGDRLQVERLGEPGTDVELTPVLVVDGDSTLATTTQLAGSKVSARVLDEVKGPKINGFTYKSKANVRKRWGHRQTYALIEITGITKG
jgi:large subunit ribosomal protein L21